MPRQTDARNAVWTAIENWPALQSGGATIFKRLYKFDGDAAPEVNPSAAELPAIAIWPDASRADMVLNRVHEHPFPLAIMLFTSTWNLETPEGYVEDIIDALWQSTAAGQTVAEVRRVTGFPPMNEFAAEYVRHKVQDVKSIIAILRVTLRLRFDPQS